MGVIRITTGPSSSDHPPTPWELFPWLRWWTPNFPWVGGFGGAQSKRKVTHGDWWQKKTLHTHTFDMAPSLDSSDHQDYYMFSRGFQPKPSLSTVTGRGPYQTHTKKHHRIHPPRWGLRQVDSPAWTFGLQMTMAWWSSSRRKAIGGTRLWSYTHPNPYHPCMVYLPTFTIKINQM